MNHLTLEMIESETLINPKNTIEQKRGSLKPATADQSVKRKKLAVDETILVTEHNSEDNEEELKASS